MGDSPVNYQSEVTPTWGREQSKRQREHCPSGRPLLDRRRLIVSQENDDTPPTHTRQRQMVQVSLIVLEQEPLTILRV